MPPSHACLVLPCLALVLLSVSESCLLWTRGCWRHFLPCWFPLIFIHLDSSFWDGSISIRVVGITLAVEYGRYLWFVHSCFALPCLALPRLALPCLVLSCLVLSCLVLSLVGSGLVWSSLVWSGPFQVENGDLSFLFVIIVYWMKGTMGGRTSTAKSPNVSQTR